MDWFLNFTKRYAPAFSLRKNLRRLFFRPIDNIGIIDGVRALSVITLMIGHLVMWLQFFYPDKKSFLLELPPMLQYLMNGSILGVNIFFVISGYLIGKILLLEFKKTQTIQITRFYKRRFLRLMPVYWLSLFIVFL
ncbi:MAG: acyltransferase family protein, partial [Gammaproteobacteria bacterium]|nr:acyltransferase family protein [Gammaproteobacteria bacterium]